MKAMEFANKTSIYTVCVNNDPFEEVGGKCIRIYVVKMVA